MLRDAGPPNWTNYYWYEVGTDLGAGKAAMIYDADILGYFNNTGTAVEGKIAWHPGTERPRWLAADQPVDLVTRDERHVAEQERGLALPAVGDRQGSPAQRRRSIRTSMIDPVRASIVEDPEFIDKMSTQMDFLETFNTVIEDMQDPVHAAASLLRGDDPLGRGAAGHLRRRRCQGDARRPGRGDRGDRRVERPSFPTPSPPGSGRREPEAGTTAHEQSPLPSERERGWR